METRFNIGLKGQTAELVNALIPYGYKPKDVIYDALSLLDFAIQEIAAGKDFGSVDRETQTMNTIATPILQHVRRHPEWVMQYLGTYGDQDLVHDQDQDKRESAA